MEARQGDGEELMWNPWGQGLHGVLHCTSEHQETAGSRISKGAESRLMKGRSTHPGRALASPILSHPGQSPMQLV